MRTSAILASAVLAAGAAVVASISVHAGPTADTTTVSRAAPAPTQPAGTTTPAPAPADLETPDPGSDPYGWLEDVNSPRATAWVDAENSKTLDVLENDPRFAGYRDQARAIATSPDRLALPRLLGGQVYNFWLDADHVRGIWRRTTVADYETPQPHWTTVLDLDALAKTEGRNWVWKGADCSSVTETRCLISLSEGGEDAKTVREFDLTTNDFVPNGFRLDRGKQSVAWLDDDTLLVSREWEPGQVTASGYPFIVKKWQRGQPLDTAVEIARGTKDDVEAGAAVLVDGDGHRLALTERRLSFFTAQYRLIGENRDPLALPPKTEIDGLVHNKLLVTLKEDWEGFHAGSLVSFDAAAVAADPQELRATLVAAPGPRDTITDVTTTRDQVIVTTLHNVRGRVTCYTPGDDGWSARTIELPDNSAIAVTAADPHSGLAYLRVNSFLTPPTRWHLDTATGRADTVKAMAPQFDASGEVVEQLEATSRDGTRVPYFVVHAADMRYDGTNPTILYAYGGFAESMVPGYSGTLGALWLRHGGVYVLANIRGGGEFGPAWHDAALTVHRQRAFDDFAAVGADLVARKITSPAHLGIQGGSNGGLLMGVEFTQHPQMWHAVDMQVPLLDMMRYEKIAAGSSWVGEYGSVNDPEQRAYLESYSPYAQLRPGVKYPEPFIWTTRKDDRVGPQHARKFAAKLSALGDPYLFYEISEGGHGAGANLDESSLTNALEFVYFARQLM
jgi:prolyl oligopeptidase